MNMNPNVHSASQCLSAYPGPTPCTQSQCAAGHSSWNRNGIHPWCYGWLAGWTKQIIAGTNFNQKLTKGIHSFSMLCPGFDASPTSVLKNLQHSPLESFSLKKPFSTPNSEESAALLPACSHQGMQELLWLGMCQQLIRTLVLKIANLVCHRTLKITKHPHVSTTCNFQYTCHCP